MELMSQPFVANMIICVLDLMNSPTISYSHGFKVEGMVGFRVRFSVID